MGTFLLSAMGISLTGVMLPGPMTAATLTAGSRQRHAGIFVALGHGLVEFPLMFLIMAGAGSILKIPALRMSVGLVGGLFLLWMGTQLLWELRGGNQKFGNPKSAEDRSGEGSVGRHPLWIGILLTGGNPGFFVWWAGIGLPLAVKAATLGTLACGLFAISHWLCDLVWYELLTLGSFKGTELLGGRLQTYILAFCGLVMLGFGLFFLVDSIAAWSVVSTTRVAG